jgi:hypothetical protein
MSQNNRLEGRQQETEGDRALERFLKFNRPQYFRKHSTKQEAETWVEQIENIFAALNYGDQKGSVRILQTSGANPRLVAPEKRRI